MFSTSSKYVALYLLVIVAANLTAAWLGPWVTPINAFLFIGLDLTTRDKLHDTWRQQHLWPKMLALVAAGGLLSWLLNRSAGRIALASTAAFLVAATTDAAIYHLARRRPRLQRVNLSNTAGALLDSLVFTTLAFGEFLPAIVALQAATKITGGALWALLLYRPLRAPRRPTGRPEP